MAMPPASRSLLRQAVVDTLASGGARAGLCWLAVLAALAVFSPFLASSHPLLMRADGRWTSPVLRHLTPSDVMLLIATAAIAFLGLARRWSFRRSLVILAGVLALAALPVYLLVRPPENVVYQQYRERIANGTLKEVFFTIVPYSPTDRLRDQPDARLKGPSKQHWMGTDTNGADLLSNLMHASRIALSIGFLSTAISVTIGIAVGGVMGYAAGTIDLIGMRFIEIIEAIPKLFLLISITAFLQKRNIYVMMTVIGLTSWTAYARFLRAEFLSLRKLDFVQAAVAAGLPRLSIIFRHMLVNGLTPVLVSTTFGVASAILYESVLSFLGLGLVDEASWGALLQQARAGGSGFLWWIATFPGLAIFLTVFSYNLVGESIRDALDPRLQKRD
jgi:peptide/nickel transport system permease protein